MRSLRTDLGVACALVVAILVAGCAKIEPRTIDINRAELMPEPAAKTLLRSKIPGYAGGDRLYILDAYFPIRSIQRLDYFTGKDALLFRQGGTSYGGALCNVSLADARQIAEALTALGASVVLSEITQLGGIVGCGDVHG